MHDGSPRSVIVAGTAAPTVRSRRSLLAPGVLAVLGGAILALLCLLAVPARAADAFTVRIEGIKGQALDNVQAALAAPPDLIQDGIVDRPWLKNLRRRAPERVRRALQPYGYFDPEVAADLVESAAGQFELRVRIKPGPPVRVDAVDLRMTGPGRNEAALKKAAAQFPLQTGDILRQDLYEKAKGVMTSRAIDLGYLDARFSEHRLAVSLAERQADIELEFDTGPLYFFGSGLIHGAPDYPDRFLRRYLAFADGDRFSYADLGQTQANYLNSDRFQDVIVTARQEMAHEQRVPVSIQLTPSDSQRLRPGIGYGTDTGARFSLRYQDVNVFERGHELQSDLSIAQIRQSASVSYRLPDPEDMNSLTALRFELEREETESFTSRTITTEVERVRTLGPGILGSVFLQLLQEDFEIGLTDRRSRLLLPGVRLTMRRVSDSVRPRKGFHLTTEARGAHPSLLSDTKLLQLQARGSLLWPLGGRFSLITRGAAATTLQDDRLAEIPATLRFFAGGDQSVRGYAYQSLGPRDSSGQVVGGKHLLTASIELERGIGEDWGLAVFYDIGNAFNALTDIEWGQGVGLGGRYYTIIGPVRVDLARRIGVGQDAYRLHVSMGFSW